MPIPSVQATILMKPLATPPESNRLRSDKAAEEHESLEILLF